MIILIEVIWTSLHFYNVLWDIICSTDETRVFFLKAQVFLKCLVVIGSHYNFGLKIHVYLSMDVVSDKLPFIVWRSRTCYHQWLKILFLDCWCNPSILVFLPYLENCPKSLFPVFTLAALVSRKMRLWPAAWHMQRKRNWPTTGNSTFNHSDNYPQCLFLLLLILRTEVPQTSPNSSAYAFILGVPHFFSINLMR